MTETVRRHLLRYWDRCRRLFSEGDYPLATFCAVTLIEEAGKAPILFLGQEKREKERMSRDHRAKQSQAVVWNLLVNSRVTRVYGPLETKFADWVREDRLMAIRNSSLYIDCVHGQLVTPDERISEEDTFLLVCMAGEVLAEMQGQMLGSSPDEWERIIREVDEFREVHWATYAHDNQSKE